MADRIRKELQLKPRMRSPGSLLVLFVLALVAVPPAHAYLDPGTGSMIIQVLIAVFVGAAFAVKVFWKRIVAFLRRVFHKDQPSS
jgi:hypothetical protein